MKLDRIGSGLKWGGISFVCAMLVLFVLKTVLPLALWGANAGAEALNAGLGMQIMMALIWAPLFETLLGQVLPQEILRRFSLPCWFCVAAGSVLWGMEHYRNGGVAHGIMALSPGAIFTFVYLRYRSGGLAAAYWTTAIGHLTHNTLVLVVSSYFPSL